MPDAKSVLEIRNQEQQQQALGNEARSLLGRGIEALDAGDYLVAHGSLKRAAQLSPEHARIRSFLGLATARLDQDFEAARTLCESAAEQEFFNPEVYLNLARVYLVFGRRAEALRYLRRGRMIDPGNEVIDSLIRRLGRRRMPIVPFLPRRHPINKALGGARALIRSSFSKRAAA